MAEGVKFIRKNGRIIPIRSGGGKTSQKSKGDSIHLKQAVEGAAAGGTAMLALNAAKHGHGKTAMVFGAAATGIGLGSLYKNVKNSFQHGNKKKSFWHGVGRNITNNWANSAGQAVGASAVLGLASLAALKKVR